MWLAAMTAASGSSLALVEIDQEIRRHDEQIRYCYQRELPRLDPREGKFVVVLTLARTGAVLDVRVTDNTLRASKVEACVLDLFRWMQFPALRSEETVVRWPLLFGVVEPPSTATEPVTTAGRVECGRARIRSRRH